MGGDRGSAKDSRPPRDGVGAQGTAPRLLRANLGPVVASDGRWTAYQRCAPLGRTERSAGPDGNPPDRRKTLQPRPRRGGGRAKDQRPDPGARAWRFGPASAKTLPCRRRLRVAGRRFRERDLGGPGGAARRVRWRSGLEFAGRPRRDADADRRTRPVDPPPAEPAAARGLREAVLRRSGRSGGEDH